MGWGLLHYWPIYSLSACLSIGVGFGKGKHLKVKHKFGPCLIACRFEVCEPNEKHTVEFHCQIVNFLNPTEPSGVFDVAVESHYQTRNFASIRTLMLVRDRMLQNPLLKTVEFTTTWKTIERAAFDKVEKLSRATEGREWDEERDGVVGILRKQ